MEVHLPPGTEARLKQTAARQGHNPDEFLQDVLARYFEQYLTHEQIGQGFNGRSGSALVEAMQASPYKEIDLEPRRDRFPVRDAVL